MKNIIHAVVLLALLAVSAPEVSANLPAAYGGILSQTDVEALVSYIRLLSH